MSNRQPPLVVTDLDVDDDRLLDTAVRLCDESLGRGLVTSDDLRARRCLGIGALSLAAFRDGELVGTANACTMTPAERTGFDKLLWAASSPRRLGDAPTGWIETLAVAKEQRGRRVGTALVTELLRRFRRSGLRLALVESWLPKGHRGSRELFAKLGFEEWAIVPDYYAELSDEGGVPCPYCGRRCHCAAAICVRAT